MRSTPYALFMFLMSALASAALAQQPERPPTPVTVVTVEAQTVTVTSTLPGRVVAGIERCVRTTNGVEQQGGRLRRVEIVVHRATERIEHVGIRLGG
ncbi:MAG: hypothetical protein RID59_09685, partial [Hoeflea sp.]